MNKKQIEGMASCSDCDPWVPHTKTNAVNSTLTASRLRLGYILSFTVAANNLYTHTSRDSIWFSRSPSSPSRLFSTVFRGRNVEIAEITWAITSEIFFLFCYDDIYTVFKGVFVFVCFMLQLRKWFMLFGEGKSVSNYRSTVCTNISIIGDEQTQRCI